MNTALGSTTTLHYLLCVILYITYSDIHAVCLSLQYHQHHAWLPFSLSLSLRQGGAASPGQLHEELLATVTQGDNVQEVSSLLCRGAPIEPPGGRSALRLAVTNDRPRTVSLLLASGASLSATLLRDAWYSANVTHQVLATLTTVSSILTCLALPCLCVSLSVCLCPYNTATHRLYW